MDNTKLELTDGQEFNPYRLFVGSFIPNWLMRNTEILPSAKLIYARLCQYAGENGECFPTRETIANEVGLSTDRVNKIIRELEVKHKLIRLEHPKGQDRLMHKSVRYHFLWNSKLIYSLSGVVVDNQCVEVVDNQSNEVVDNQCNIRESYKRESYLNDNTKVLSTISKEIDLGCSETVAKPSKPSELLKTRRLALKPPTSVAKPKPSEVVLNVEYKKLISRIISLFPRPTRLDTKYARRIQPTLVSLFNGSFFQDKSDYKKYASTKFALADIELAFSRYTEYLERPHAASMKRNIADFFYSSGATKLKSLFIYFLENEIQPLIKPKTDIDSVATESLSKKAFKYAYKNFTISDVNAIKTGVESAYEVLNDISLSKTEKLAPEFTTFTSVNLADWIYQTLLEWTRPMGGKYTVGHLTSKHFKDQFSGYLTSQSIVIPIVIKQKKSWTFEELAELEKENK